MAYENHWLPGFNFNVEEWDATGLHYETLAICRTLALACAAFAAAIPVTSQNPAERPRLAARDQARRLRSGVLSCGCAVI
jgi:hypothetical protein